MNILVFGGTRYFGKHLVQHLLHDGHAVTLVTRGLTKDDFGSSVERLTADRDNEKSLKKAFQDRSWDLAYDQICYSSNAARRLCVVLDGKIKQLVFTSSQSVYPEGAALKEQDFDPRAAATPLRWGERDDFSYADGKKLAEAVYTQVANFPVTAVRFPIVLGLDDYTKRLHFHVERIATGKPIYFPAIESKISFVSSVEAGRFLAWLADHPVDGAINACSRAPIVLKDLVALIEARLNKKIVYASEGDESNSSPFGIASDWYMNTQKVQELGFRFLDLERWLPGLVDEIGGKPHSAFG